MVLEVREDPEASLAFLQALAGEGRTALDRLLMGER